MKNIFSSLRRKSRRSKTINEILRSPQSNDSVVNIHRLDHNNVGDLYCAPHHYFDVLKDKGLDIFDYQKPDIDVRRNFIDTINASALIIGGGGFLNRSGFSRQMSMFEKLTDKNKKIVLWGIGHNSKHPKHYNKVSDYSVDSSKFGLVGTRDVHGAGEYVPCVSCLHSVFDNVYDETRNVGVVFHKDTLKRKTLLRRLENYQTTSNTTNMEEIVAFIGGSNTVVTDSYHAMYWSFLMGKKVVAIPNSTKFFDFKYKPVVSTFQNFETDISKGISYSGLLEECREINLKFADKAFDYLNL